MPYFSDVYQADLSHREKAVYQYLKDRSSLSGNCWPGVRTIMKDLNLSRRTVQRALADLERRKLIQRQPRYRENGSTTSNLYIVE